MTPQLKEKWLHPKDRRRRIQTIRCVQEDDDIVADGEDDATDGLFISYCDKDRSDKIEDNESFYAHTNERKNRRRRIQSTQNTM